MIRLALAYLAGVVTVTAVVVSTGGGAGTMVAVGAGLAVVAIAALVAWQGLERVGTFLIGLHDATRAVRRPAVAPVVEPDQETISAAVDALVKLGAKQRVAKEAVRKASATGPMEFEPLFRRAVSVIR